MKMNDIKFLPITTPMGKVYEEITGSAFVGAMVSSAASIEPAVTPKCATPTYTTFQPTIDCNGTTMYDTFKLTLACATENSTLHYKAVGYDKQSTLTAEDYDWTNYSVIDSNEYASPYTTSFKLLMMAYATADGYDNSDILYITMDVEYTADEYEFYSPNLTKCSVSELLAVNGVCATAAVSGFEMEEGAYNYCGTSIDIMNCSITFTLDGTWYSTEENLMNLNFDGSIDFLINNESYNSGFSISGVQDISQVTAAYDAEKSALLTAYKDDGSTYYVYEFDNTELSGMGSISGGLSINDMYESVTVTPSFNGTQFSPITMQNDCYEEPVTEE